MIPKLFILPNCIIPCFQYIPENTKCNKPTYLSTKILKFPPFYLKNSLLGIFEVF